ncbi:hypothetical protein FZEAL_2843 [Fusarium zealandicum]|uniref:Phosphatidate phosphatase APP1 catalytic domain-containing protein n=1 Tax=Fusarium zealandicum TaxID=1053134 RepID=A0A8H4UQ07_9HYPO|nr:hypothetical protein FZEAL_2843 [Fusarium zealandicum]
MEQVHYMHSTWIDATEQDIGDSDNINPRSPQTSSETLVDKDPLASPDLYDNNSPKTKPDASTDYKAHPTPARRPKSWSTFGRLVLDLIITAPAVCFLAFVSCVIKPGGLGAETEMIKNLHSAASWGPTVFPIAFAATVANAPKAMAAWRLERGITVLSPELLLSSLDVFSAITVPFSLWTVTGLMPLLMVLWAASPVGGQAALRAVKIAPSASTEPWPAQYLDPPEIKSDSQDALGNIKIPLVESYMSSDADRDIDGWFSTDLKRNITYSSLSGLPMGVLRRGPDILDRASLLLSDNPNASFELVGSMEDGFDVARRMKDVYVCLGDTKPDEDVGHLSVGALQELVPLSKQTVERLPETSAPPSLTKVTSSPSTYISDFEKHLADSNHVHLSYLLTTLSGPNRLRQKTHPPEALLKRRAPHVSCPILFFGPYRPHPRNRQSLVRFFFPHAFRERYRERLLRFHLDTLPDLKHKFQSRVYRYIVERQRRRTEKSRILDIVARQGRRLWLGSQVDRPVKHARTRHKGLVARKMPTIGEMTGYGSDRATSPSDRERGFRRKRLAAMAGNLYRSGQAAVTEIKESYAQTRARGDGGSDNHGRIHIPGAFPDAAITVQGDDQMVLFPSYAKRHTKQVWGQTEADQTEEAYGSIKDENFWRQEWERDEDEKAIVDVDVRGWIYSPHTGPMTRRNRVLIGLARQLSGIPAPSRDQVSNQNPGPLGAHHQMHDEQREQEKIEQEARRIERQGQQEKRVAYRGGYSERTPDNNDPESDSFYYPSRSRSGNQSPESAPSSPTMPARRSTGTELSEAELVLANANLMARISPFMTNPSVALPITLFFYNDTKSQSKTVMTNDAGHFVIRAALDFIPTHVRVLANEDLSATQLIKVIEPRGVSLISDVDDTVKKSNISGGAKEIFRNTFIRDLSDLSVEGVKEWYNRMYDLGVSIHYCSNSPWQLFPVLASFLKLHGLPPGSLHLKQYSGMLQGIFEPVAERKKSTLGRLLRDFPERSFILVGDSGEADLEVYTELAVSNPGRILAVFIRDVTTPEETPFFDTGFNPTRSKPPSFIQNDGSRNASSQNLIPGAFRERRPSTGPAMGTLIDLSDEPQETKVDRSAALAQIRNANPGRTVSASDIGGARKPPPPRPAKPAALRSAKSITDLNKGVAGPGLSRQNSDEPPPPLPRKPIVQVREPTEPHPLSRIQNSSSQQSIRSGNSAPKIPAQPRSRNPSGSGSSGDRPPPPPPRRRGTPSSIADPGSRPPPRHTQTTTNLDVDYEPLPPPTSGTPSFGTARSGTRSDGNTPTGGSPTLGPQAVNKKLELWKRRLARAHEQLDGLGVALYTWRRGNDVIREAEGIVKQAQADMERKSRNR